MRESVEVKACSNDHFACSEKYIQSDIIGNMYVNPETNTICVLGRNLSYEIGLPDEAKIELSA